MRGVVLMVRADCEGEVGQNTMESDQRVPRKGRKLGSSRRRQMRETADGEDVPVAPEPGSWSSQAAAELQGFFQDCGAKERGFVTREDLAVAKFSFLGSEEELEMIFDWVDMERKGRLSLEEFSSGLKNIFGSSLSTHRLHRQRPLPSKRESVATSFPVLEEADAAEKEAFSAFMEQLGASHLLPEQAEIWQLWRKLRQEEPQLAGNLEGFLAKMTGRLQEARADKEVLELTLRKRDSDHHHEVQQLYEEMEQQIQWEKQQLQAESDSRGLALSSQMQEVLEAKEREVQRLTEGQKELEAQLHRLSSTHQEASSENQQLREAERDLAGRLEEVRGKLQAPAGPREQFQALYPGDEGPELGPVPAKLPRQREALHQDPHATGSEPGHGSPEAGALIAGLAEPSQGLEPVGQIPTERLEQSKPGPDVQESHPGGLQGAHGQILGPEGLPALAHQGLEEESRVEEREHMASEPPSANPDYAFHVIFLGDSNVGKTSFLHLLHQNSFATQLTATVGVDFRVKNLMVDNKCFALQLWDTAGQERYHSMTRQLLRKADGVVLMYDVTSQESFAHVRYWLDCLQDTVSDGVVILLLGNKMDCKEERQVSTEAGQQLAQELGVSFGECSAALGHNILEPVVNLARSLKMQEDRLKGSLVEVAPEKPPKRAGCCS
ncbi:ras-related protein Rab-44-like protein [Camelus ferus]|nr:ras-related protein Rab-44-like protein [Camelus ferus]